MSDAKEIAEAYRGGLGDGMLYALAVYFGRTQDSRRILAEIRQKQKEMRNG